MNDFSDQSPFLVFSGPETNPASRCLEILETFPAGFKIDLPAFKLWEDICRMYGLTANYCVWQGRIIDELVSLAEFGSAILMYDHNDGKFTVIFDEMISMFIFPVMSCIGLVPRHIRRNQVRSESCYEAQILTLKSLVREMGEVLHKIQTARDFVPMMGVQAFMSPYREAVQILSRPDVRKIMEEE